MRWRRTKPTEAENFVICEIYFRSTPHWRRTTTPKFDSSEHLFPDQCFQFVYWMALICTLIEQISGSAQSVPPSPPPSIHIEPVSNILPSSVFVDQTACQLTATHSIKQRHNIECAHSDAKPSAGSRQQFGNSVATLNQFN